MLFLYIPLIAGTLLSIINISFFQSNLNLNWYEIIFYVFISIVAVFAIDAITALLVKFLPAKWFKPEKKIFKTYKWEKKFYQSLGIKKWKDKIPEWGKLSNFSKSKIEDPTNNEYIGRFITESLYGEVIHFLSMIFGFLIILISPKRWLYIGLPIGFVNAFSNIPSYFILRYNRPKLMVIFERNKRVSERRLKKANESNA